MKPLRLFAGILAVVVVCGIGTAFIQQQIDPTSFPTIIYRSNTRQYSSTDLPSFTDLEAVGDSLVLNTPLPSGFTLTTADGKVTATITDSFFGPPAEYSISITVLADSEDLYAAQLFLNDQVIFTASRVGGSIVDRNGKALATLTGLVPQTGPFAVKVVWEATDGQTREESVTL